MPDTAALLERQHLGQPSGLIPLTSRQEFRVASQLLAQQAARRMELLTYDLDAMLYDQLPFVDAVKQLCLLNRNSQVSILLQNNEPVQKQGHRLLELARRIPSRIAIRRPHADYLNHQENFLLADRIGYLRRRRSSRYHGEINFFDRLETERLGDFFREVWDCSEADIDLRRLDI